MTRIKRERGHIERSDINKRNDKIWEVTRESDWKKIQSECDIQRQTYRYKKYTKATNEQMQRVWNEDERDVENEVRDRGREWQKAASDIRGRPYNTFFPTQNLWIHKLRQNFNSEFWPLDGSWNLEKFKPNVFNITPNLPAPVVNVIKLFRGNLDFAQS